MRSTWNFFTNGLELRLSTLTCQSFSDTDAIWVRPLDNDMRAYDAVSTFEWSRFPGNPNRINMGVTIGKRNAPFWQMFQVGNIRADSRFTPSQWETVLLCNSQSETALLCNDVSHWLGTSLKSDSRLAPSQWEMVLLCNDVSNWLGASLESALLSWHMDQILHKASTQVCQPMGVYCVDITWDDKL